MSQVPNEDLIRAVLDGKTVQYRYKPHGANAPWQEFKYGPSAAIKSLVEAAPMFEFRLKPERRVVWFGIYPETSEPHGVNATMGVPEKELLLRSGNKYESILRVELDPDTLKVIDARTESST